MRSPITWSAKDCSPTTRGSGCSTTSSPTTSTSSRPSRSSGSCCGTCTGSWCARCELPRAREPRPPERSAAGEDEQQRAEQEGGRGEEDERPRPERGGASLRQWLVGPSSSAALRTAHAVVAHHWRKRNGVVSASRADTLLSCFRVRFNSLPWYV